jgi:hypothetical protein
LGSGTVKKFEQPGLFKILPDRLRATRAAEELAAVVPHARPARMRPEARRRQRETSAFHRYCSGCSRETEHVHCTGSGPTNMPCIQWPAAEPASGSTICLDCGQWRAATSRRSPTVWSSWPNKPGELSVAAEKEAMPPRPERPSARVFLRTRQATVPRRRPVPARGRQAKPVAVSPSGGREER